MMLKASGIILAGGSSSRLGADKAELVVGTRMIDRVALALSQVVSEIVIAGPTRQTHACGVPVSFVPDAFNGSGPLVGIYSALLSSRTDANIVIACDMPFVNPSLLRFLLQSSVEADVTIAEVGGVLQPLHAVYRKGVLGAMEHLLRSGETSPRRLLAAVGTKIVRESAVRVYDPQMRSFFSVNTPKDLMRAREWAGTEVSL
jgi:molybdenum cofactor guanylyltransferase